MKKEFQCRYCEKYHPVLMFEILDEYGLMCRYCLLAITGYNSVADYWKDHHLDPERDLDDI